MTPSALAPILTLLTTLFLALLITRIASVALMLTGLSLESARFQARSAFSGVGFTTAEAEQVVRHPVRRRIVMALMLFGNIGLLAVGASLVASFVMQSQSGGSLSVYVFLVVGLAVLWVITASKWVDRRLSGVIAWALRRWTRIDTRDYASLLHVGAGYSVAEAAIQEGDTMAGRTVEELRVTSGGVLCLGIKREMVPYIGAPRGDTRIEVDDVVILYGRIDHLDRACRKTSTAT